MKPHWLTALVALTLVAASVVLYRGIRMAAPSADRRALPPSGFEAGQVFPPIALPALESGRPASLADFRGRKLILHIFASW